MGPELLGAMQPLAIIAALLGGIVVLRLALVILAGLFKVSLVVGVIWCAVQFLPAVPTKKIVPLLSSQLGATWNQLAGARGLVSEQLRNYQLHIVLGEKEKQDKHDPHISRF